MTVYNVDENLTPVLLTSMHTCLFVLCHLLVLVLFLALVLLRLVFTTALDLCCVFSHLLRLCSSHACWYMRRWHSCTKCERTTALSMLPPLLSLTCDLCPGFQSSASHSDATAQDHGQVIHKLQWKQMAGQTVGWNLLPSLLMG